MTASSPRTGRSSARRRPSPISADGVALTGPSNRPDPRFNAYRKDLADRALAATVIASHYADQVELVLKSPAVLRCEPSNDSAALAELAAGAPFAMLDDTMGWAWGYGGGQRLVGYVPSQALKR